MQPIHFCSQPDIAEARGLLTTAKCKDLNLENVIFEGDSVQVVNAMRQSNSQNGILSCLVEETKTNCQIQNGQFIMSAGMLIKWLINLLKRLLH